MDLLQFMNNGNDLGDISGTRKGYRVAEHLPIKKSL